MKREKKVPFAIIRVKSRDQISNQTMTGKPGKKAEKKKERERERERDRDRERQRQRENEE